MSLVWCPYFRVSLIKGLVKNQYSLRITELGINVEVYISNLNTYILDQTKDALSLGIIIIIFIIINYIMLKSSRD